MKKLGLIMVLIMGFCSVSYGQLFPPIQPYNENGYSNQDFINFSLNLGKNVELRLKNRDLSADYRNYLLKKVKEFLILTGLNKSVNDGNLLAGEEGIKWIFDPSRSWAEDRIYPDGYWNTHQNNTNGNSVILHWDKKYFRGPVMVLHVGEYELDLAKIICMNIVDVPYITIKNIKPLDPGISSEDKTKLRQLTSLPYDYADYNKKNVVQKIDLGLTYHEEEKTKTWFGRNWLWVVPAGVALISAGCHFGPKLFDHPHHYGNPGGAPTTINGPSIPAHHPVITPPIIIPPVNEPGGPGGAPTTPGAKNHSFSFVLRF